MRTWITALMLVLAVLAVGIALLGCSGAGTTAAQVSGARVQTLATDNLSAVVLMGSWLKILYPATPSPGKCTVTTDVYPLGGGAFHITGTESDCGVIDYTEQADGSGSGRTTWPGGLSSTKSWSAPVVAGAKQTWQIDQTTPEGAYLNYASVLDAGLPGAPLLLQGTVTLPDGKTMGFAWERANDREDLLTLNLPDGSSLEMTVPLARLARQPNQPVYSSGGEGTFKDAAGVTLKLHFNGSADHWKHWGFTATGGMAGSFSLAQGVSGGGAGLVTQGGKLAGTLSWLANGKGTLSLLGATVAQLTPSAAAFDFETDRWIHNLGLLGPGPEY